MFSTQSQEEREGKKKKEKKSHFRSNLVEPQYTGHLGRKGRIKWYGGSAITTTRVSCTRRSKLAERLTRWRLLCMCQQLFFLFCFYLYKTKNTLKTS
jgi:hypothetical protein